jgi:hypothetical protein
MDFPAISAPDSFRKAPIEWGSLVQQLAFGEVGTLFVQLLRFDLAKGTVVVILWQDPYQTARCYNSSARQRLVLSYLSI